jgi:polyamine oxidase
MGGFSDENNLCIDQRGFKTIIQAEAAEFLQPQQVSLNSVVTTIAYSGDGVTVTLEDNTTLTADYVLCTFSLGVLQYGDIAFKPTLPSWKMEAIQSMVMVCFCQCQYFRRLNCIQATYTKIFLQFEERFWFDTEVRMNTSVKYFSDVSRVDGYLCRHGTGEVPDLAESRPRQVLPWFWSRLCDRHRKFGFALYASVAHSWVI